MSEQDGGQLTSTGGTIPAELITTLLGNSFSPALQVILNDALYRRCIDVASKMARAEGVTPKHLIGKPEACFSIVQMSITWKLAPQMVAGATYATPGGRIGYQGNLCQAILENSGKLKGGVKFEYFGEWDKVLGKFKIATGTSGSKYAQATYTEKDEEGLGIIVRAQVVGEDEPRAFKMLLRQAFPRNSTLWATDPMTQLGYTAVRRFGNVAAPGIFMGVPFDRDDFDNGMAIDHNPAENVGRPTQARPAKPAAQAKKMNSDFKETVGKPPVAETVIAPQEDEHAEDQGSEETEEHQGQEEGQDVQGEAAAVEEGAGDAGGEEGAGGGGGDGVDPVDTAGQQGDGGDGGGDVSGDDSQYDVDEQPDPPKAAPVAKAHPAPAAAAGAPKPAGPRPGAPKAPAAPAPAAAKPAPAPAALEPYTPEELKQFLRAGEKSVVGAPTVAALDSWRLKNVEALKRLKISSQESYDHLVGMMNNKKQALLNQEDE